MKTKHPGRGLGFCLFFALATPAFSQLMVRDTLQVRFPHIARPVAPVYINRVDDARGRDFSGINSSVVGEYETTHLYFFPVDQLICTPEALTREIQAVGRETHAPDVPAVNIRITSFKFSDRGGWLRPGYLLSSSFQVFDASDKFLGELVYESRVPKTLFSSKKTKHFEQVLARWAFRFQEDLAAVALSKAQESMPIGFRPGLHSGKQLNMIGGLSGAVLLNATLVDGDLYFSRREAEPMFFRTGKVLRYRNEDDFESIGFSLVNDYWFRRLNPRWVVQGNVQLFLGVNRWKDIETGDHKLWDAMQGEFSLKQGLYFNRFDRSSLIFGAGLLEDVTYIYSKGLRFDVGAFVQVGVKL